MCVRQTSFVNVWAPLVRTLVFMWCVFVMDLKGASLGVTTSLDLDCLFVVFAVVAHTPR
jgi:hypothetical protein